MRKKKKAKKAKKAKNQGEKKKSKMLRKNLSGKNLGKNKDLIFMIEIIILLLISLGAGLKIANEQEKVGGNEANYRGGTEVPVYYPAEKPEMKEKEWLNYADKNFIIKYPKGWTVMREKEGVLFLGPGGSMRVEQGYYFNEYELQDFVNQGRGLEKMDEKRSFFGQNGLTVEAIEKNKLVRQVIGRTDAEPWQVIIISQNIEKDKEWMLETADSFLVR